MVGRDVYTDMWMCMGSKETFELRFGFWSLVTYIYTEIKKMKVMLVILTVNVFSRLIATRKMEKIDWVREFFILGTGFCFSMVFYQILSWLFL